MTAEKVKGGYKIRYEKTGKLGPKKYSSHAAAEKRIHQIEYFKHHPTPQQASKKGKR